MKEEGYVDLSSIADTVDMEERRYYELVDDPSAAVLSSGNYMYTRIGVALISSILPTLNRNIVIPKVLYRDSVAISAEQISRKEADKEKGMNIGVFADKQLTIPCAVIDNEQTVITISSAGMDVENAVLFTYYCDVNKKVHPEIYKQIKKPLYKETYFIYEVWVRKCVYDILHKLEGEVFIKDIHTEIDSFKKMRLSNNSIAYKYIQTNIYKLEAVYDISKEITTKEFGDIASEENMKWLSDDENYISFVRQFNKLLDRIEKHKPKTDEEKWFNTTNEIYLDEYLPQEICDKFNEYYKTYQEV